MTELLPPAEHADKPFHWVAENDVPWIWEWVPGRSAWCSMASGEVEEWTAAGAAREGHRYLGPAEWSGA